MIKFVANITLGLEKHEHIVAIFIDLSKAFDCLDYGHLNNKPDSLRGRGILTKWLKLCLNERLQKIKIQGKYSNEECINTGIPQGSILDPTLFIMFINDISKIFNNSEIEFIAESYTT